MTSTLYGMITVKSSSYYTRIALESFFKHTELKTGDAFCLIDNDGYWVNTFSDFMLPNDCIIQNDIPKNTAENINQLIALAIKTGRHLVFLNNDVIFTPHWYSRIVIDDKTLSIASCNQVADCGFPSSTSLEEFNYQYSKLNAVSHIFHSKFSKPFERLIMPTFACRIPIEILSNVGYFDEEFHVGGEDVDYRLRLLKHGFTIKYSSAFLLHFNGKSSWNGPETDSETTTRNRKYFEVFSKKWGLDLANLCLINGNPEQVIKDHSLFGFLDNACYNDMIIDLLKLY